MSYLSLIHDNYYCQKYLFNETTLRKNTQHRISTVLWGVFFQTLKSDINMNLGKNTAHTLIAKLYFSLEQICKQFISREKGKKTKQQLLSYYSSLLAFMSSVQFSRSVVSDSLRPHELQHTRPPCPSPTPGAHPDSCPSSQ